MASKAGENSSRLGAPLWSSWADLPAEMQSAVVWAFWAGGPSDTVDKERFEAALTVGTPMHDAAFLEEGRWMVRSLEALNMAGAFQAKLPKERIFEAVALWMNKAVGSVKRDAGGYAMRGKPRSSRWAVESAQDWMKQHRELPFLAESVPDFGPVMELLKPGCYTASFGSWRWHFGDGFGRQIKPTWSNRVLRKNLFERKGGVHWGYVMRDLPSQSGPGGLIFEFPRLDPTPMEDLNHLDFGYWTTRWLTITGTSAFPLSETPPKN